MRSLRLLALMVLLATASALFADGIVNTCPNGTLQDYLDLGPSGCILGDKKFTDFQQPFVGDFRTGVKTKASLPFFPGNIAVLPIDTPGDPGFVFDFGNATFPSGGVEGTDITYAITVLRDGSTINGASLSINATADGAGSAVAVEDLNCTTETGPCHTGGTTGGTDQLLALVCILGNCEPDQPTDSAPFPSVKRLFVTDTFYVDTGDGGDVTISTVTEQFPEVPEPSTILLLATAGLALLLKTPTLRHRSRR
jgi:hypothetical protein